MKPKQGARGSYRRNPHHKRSDAEEKFKDAYGDYPKSQHELNQFLPYLRFKQISRMWKI